MRVVLFNLKVPFGGVKQLLLTVKKEDNSKRIQNNFETIIDEFNWEKINGDYLRLFEKGLAGNTTSS